MIGVDVCTLYRNEGLDILRTRTKTLSKKIGHNFDELSLKTRIATELSGTTSVADFDEFLINKLNASLTRDLEKFDLWLYQ